MEYCETIKDTQNNIIFIIIKQKLYYNQWYKPIFFKIGD